MPTLYGNGIEKKMVFRRYNGTDMGNGAKITYRVTTRLRTGRPGVRIRAGPKYSTLLKSSDRPRGPTQAPIKWAPMTVCPGVKRSEREAGYSHLCSAEVRMNAAVPPLLCTPSWFACGDNVILPLLIFGNICTRSY